MSAETLHYYEEPRFARWLFGTRSAAALWLVARLYLGFYWTKFGWEKIFGAGSDWMTTGATLETYLDTQVETVYFGWYGDFLSWMADTAVFWGKAIAVGEFAIGVALLLGAFTGVAAFFGLLLNVSIVMAAFGGPAPLFLIIEIGLVLAWRNAGYYGLDRFLLPLVGTREEPGKLFRRYSTPSRDKIGAGIN